jgi:L-threonylcarbamoyladenylate synthase
MRSGRLDASGRVSKAAARWRWGESLEPLRSLLRRGGVLGIPTESSYGLGADPRSTAGVEAIYRLKGREAGKPLPVVVAGRPQLADLGIAPDLPILSRLGGLWPGPLTLVLPLAEDAPDLPAAAGRREVAVRVPGHEPLRSLLEEVGPLTATSANLAGEAPILEPEAVCRLLAEADALVVDGGRLPGGPPSTLVAWKEGGLEVLRPGAVGDEELQRLAGAPAVDLGGG